MSPQRVLLDTNVLSELMRPRPDAQVLSWFAAKDSRTQFLVTAITQAEILLGIALLPAGRKRTQLAKVAADMFAQDFQGATLSFDENAAQEYASIVALRRRHGRPIAVEDAQIAAIATHHRLPLVTRNTKDFEHLSGVVLINPWETTVAS